MLSYVGGGRLFTPEADFFNTAPHTGLVRWAHLSNMGMRPGPVGDCSGDPSIPCSHVPGAAAVYLGTQRGFPVGCMGDKPNKLQTNAAARMRGYYHFCLPHLL